METISPNSKILQALLATLVTFCKSVVRLAAVVTVDIFLIAVALGTVVTVLTIMTW